MLPYSQRKPFLESMHIFWKFKLPFFSKGDWKEQEETEWHFLLWQEICACSSQSTYVILLYVKLHFTGKTGLIDSWTSRVMSCLQWSQWQNFHWSQRSKSIPESAAPQNPLFSCQHFFFLTNNKLNGMCLCWRTDIIKWFVCLTLTT